MNNRLLFFFSLLSACSLASAQRIQKLETHGSASLRGLSVVDDRVIWVSGSSGTVGKSTDSGATWTWIKVEGFESRDFRDIEAFDEMTAIIMAVAEPAVILKTRNGGKTWETVYTDSARGIFLDAMDFSPDHREGMVVGDPLQGLLYVAITRDRGDHWVRESGPAAFRLDSGEAMFAASGTNIKWLSGWTTGLPRVAIVTGGKRSRLIYNGTAHDLPLVHGRESTGANGVDILPDGSGIIVGGDFAKDSVSSGNCVLFTLGNHISFSEPASGPHGYRSAVAFLDDRRLICCGSSGVDISKDGGLHWELISGDAYHVCKKAKSGQSAFLAGPRGRIAKLIW